jgi:hypothetical protein
MKSTREKHYRYLVDALGLRSENHQDVGPQEHRFIAANDDEAQRATVRFRRKVYGRPGEIVIHFEVLEEGSIEGPDHAFVPIRTVRVFHAAVTCHDIACPGTLTATHGVHMLVPE